MSYDLKQLGQNVPYPTQPEEAILETFANPASGRNYTIAIHCPEFTTLCPITNQPDFATFDISYIPDELCIESKALKLYLFSFRNIGSFHEAVTNRILDDLVKACQPKWMEIKGNFNSRGGIGFVITATHGLK
jgi:7-cyano-7-deazaguanine reductase